MGACVGAGDQPNGPPTSMLPSIGVSLACRANTLSDAKTVDDSATTSAVAAAMRAIIAVDTIEGKKKKVYGPAPMGQKKASKEDQKHRIGRVFAISRRNDSQRVPIETKTR